MTIQELRDQKGNLAKQADDVLKAAKEEGRFELRAEEEAKFDAIHADIERINGYIARLEKQEALTEGQGRRSEPNPTSSNSTETRGRSESRVIRPTDMLEGLRSWLLAGSDAERTPEMRAAAERTGINLDRKQFSLRLPEVAMRATGIAGSHRVTTSDDVRDWREANEQRAALGTTSGGVGGYTVPDELMRQLEVSLLAFGGMRQVATVLRTGSGAALPIPTVNDTANKGAILAENVAASEQDTTFAQLVLDSYKYTSKYILVSVELLQDSSINVASFLGSALANRIGRITNDHFSTGTGSSQPNGIVTASGLGKTGATGQTATIIYDDFVDLEHSVDPAYRSGARFMMSDAMLKVVKKIKVAQYSGDTAGYPLWMPGLVTGQPDTILGYPFTINQSMASPTASAKTVVFGSLDKYLIRDVRDITLLRLDERFAEYHQVAFLAFSRHDGDLLDAGTDPVKHYIQAASYQPLADGGSPRKTPAHASKEHRQCRVSSQRIARSRRSPRWQPAHRPSRVQRLTWPGTTVCCSSYASGPQPPTTTSASRSATPRAAPTPSSKGHWSGIMRPTTHSCTT
jgi:HK97 family phage major capsid protein